MKTEPTTFYQYANDEKEYVFCVKGRPFACLTSPHLPTPTASLIDYAPQAPDKFNPKVNPQTCGIIQMLYETKQIETMTFGKSVIALFSKIEPKTSN